MTRLRLAEIVGCLSVASDLGTGFPAYHAIRACLVALRLAVFAGLAGEDLADVYYLTALRMLGCTADSDEGAEFFGDEIAIGRLTQHLDFGDPAEMGTWVMEHFAAERPGPERAVMLEKMFAFTPDRRRRFLAAHCEVAALLATQLTMRPQVSHGLQFVFERWDGSGAPRQVAGEAIPTAARIMALATELEVHARLAGIEKARDVAERRSGSAFDPNLVRIFLRRSEDVLDVLDARSPWDSFMAAEPAPVRLVGDLELTSMLEVIGQFTDLKSRHTLGHSAGVARLARDAAAHLGLPGDACARAHQAGLVHDLGRVTVSTAIWDRPGPLADEDWEKVRLHPYYTERFVGRAPALVDVAALAGLHHERLDGSGYHRGASGASLEPAARVLAAADVYQAMTEERVHRPAYTGVHAAELLAREARAGRLDGGAANAVLSAAGHAGAAARTRLPGGLTPREVDVLRAAARGSSIRDIADGLHIAPKTADRHLQNIYAKIGVSTRAAASVFAMRHHLLDQRAADGAAADPA